MMLAIENTPRDYAWGRTGAISALLGRVVSGEVEAELWLGAHRGSPSRIVGDARTVADVAPDLPFLLKVLAAGSPLSLQAHPNAEQAREGFERENAAGIALDAPHRNYRDPHPKPELVVAVSETFEALSGFRPAAEARADVLRIASRADGQDDVAPLVTRLVNDRVVGDAFVWLLEGGPEVTAVLGAVTRGLQGSPDDLAHLVRIAELYPGDAGIVGALLLHHIVLTPGQALYLPAGNVHAYLDGVGIELMAPSDNVLRGGLTQKHVDVPELARVLDRAAHPVPLLKPVALAEGGVIYAPNDPEAAFSLARLNTRGILSLSGPAIALCLDGAFSIRGDASAIEISRGDAVLATPDEGVLRVEGSGTLYLAR